MRLLSVVIFLFSNGILGLEARGKPAKKPNIIFILVDDLGWSDLACYGNKIYETPHINQLAAGGMKFTHAYAAAPICSASRASLLTGKSPATLQFEFVTKADGSVVPENTLLMQPAYPRDLPLEEITVAEVIDTVYRRGYFGKWHLTQENNQYLGWGSAFGPLQQGFAEGSESRGSHSYGYRPREKNTFSEDIGFVYPVDQLTAEAIAFMKKNKDHPFFMYYSLYYVHAPVKTRSRILYEKYKEKLGADADDNKVHYGAFIETMDHYIGDLLKALKALGLEEKTMIIFTSDNGGDPRFSDATPLKGGKWTLYEGGIRIPTIVSWPGVIKAGNTSDIPIIGWDWLPTISALTDSARVQATGLEGVNLLPLFSGDTFAEDRVLYWHFPFYHQPVVNSKPQSAIRMGSYKLIYFYEKDKIQLYNLDNDPGEQHDLSVSEKTKAIKMKDILLKKLNDVNARIPKKKEQI